MREIEAQPVGRDQRALLRDVIAEHLAQRLVQQMRRRMVAPDRAAAGVIDLERQRLADLERALLDRAVMHEQVAGLLLRVGHREAHAVGRHRAGVADLAAGLAVERRLVDDHRAGLAGLQLGDFLAVADERRDDAFGGLGLVAEELGRAELLAERKPRGRSRGLARSPTTRRAPSGLLLLHRRVEGVEIDADAARRAAHPG